MQGIPTPGTPRPLAWLAIACKSIYEKRNLIGVVILLAFLIGVGVNLVFTPWPWGAHLKEMPIGWVFLHFDVSLPVGICLLLLIFIIYLGNLLPVFLTDKLLKQYYLEYLIESKETIEFNSLAFPPGLVVRDVPLDRVFIPMRFSPTKPLDTYLPNAQEILEAEQELVQKFKEGQTIDIASLWKRLTKARPVAVIQGFPGMGKSTFLDRLTLRMARYSSGKTDPKMTEPKEPDDLNPTLIPIFFSLKDYADKCGETPVLSLLQYLKSVLVDDLKSRLESKGLEPKSIEPNIDNLVFRILRKSLNAQQCLVMFDGIDEVLERRGLVQDTIKEFIHLYSPQDTENFNRFLITTRVAGYDPNAFPYDHYFIAELVQEQIKDFLPRLVQAEDLPSSENSDGDQQKAIIPSQVVQTVKDLNTLIEYHQGVRELAVNPLLLTLLVLIGLNNVLPNRRVILYKNVIATLLENRNLAKGLGSIDPEQYNPLLGTIANDMVEKRNILIQPGDVEYSLSKDIQVQLYLDGRKGNIKSEAKKRASDFLKRVYERGGVFVLYAGDFYGFFHRAFQDYFAAQHMIDRHDLRETESPEQDIPKLLDLVHQADKRWREPFFLAVTYTSDINEVVTDRILKALLDTTRATNFEYHVQDLILASECLIEAKPTTIQESMERSIAEQLLETYEKASNNQSSEICCDIEKVIRSWLETIHRGKDNPILLNILKEAIKSRDQLRLQHATLTLLSRISRYLTTCPPVVFNMLIPSLKERACLNAADEHQPSFDPFENELKSLARTVCIDLSSVDNEEARKTMLDILSSMSISSEYELIFVRQLEKSTPDQRIRQTCREALEKIAPQMSEVLEKLESGEYLESRTESGKAEKPLTLDRQEEK